MAKGMAGTKWRRLLVLLIVTSGVAFAWVKVRRRKSAGSMPRSWSELDPTAPASLELAAAQVSVAAQVVAKPAEAATPGPYPGSVLPLEDGSAPSEDFVVKGNAGSMRSHSPSSPYFGRTRAEVWFRTQQDAAAAGFEPWAPKR